MGLRIASLFIVWLALSDANEIRKGRTRNHGHYVCSTWGNNHFKTFDGDIYQFPGICEYNFASDCRESYKEFSIHIQRALNSNNHPEIQYILLTIRDFTVYLRPKLAVVDGRIVKTPYYSSGLLIESNDIYTKVYAKLGLILIWNQEDALMVELDSKFNNHTCGLCGDYNGVPIYNEFINGDASYNSITYGNLQKISKPNAKCEDPDETQALPSCNEHRDECERLLTSSAFADCWLRLNFETYIQACMQDKCACNGNEDSFCLCSTISEYSRQCSHAGGRPSEWRTQYFCRTVYDDITEKGCIPASQCHCKLHGKQYSPGESITNECEECTCNSGRWMCKDLPCPGTCSVEGGSHITTFDGKKYTFHGDCYYVLAKVVVFRSDGSVLLNDMTVNVPHVSGLCGNFNGMEGDDFKTSSGLVEATGSAFANTWKAQSTCIDQVENLEDPCSFSIESANYAEHWCSLLKNPEGPFARCHEIVDPSEYYKFQAECVSGCVCPEGLFDDGKGGCVEEKDCPCSHNNQQYSPGEKITVDCNTCTCQKGDWSCTKDLCYGTCMIYGSGHYITFDGKFYDFDGSCEYVATQDFCGDKNSSGSFSIITENVPCGTTGVTCSKAIKIFLGKTELKLENKDYKEIQRDIGDDVQYWNRTVGLYLVIEASNGVMLIWDKKTTVFIKLTPDYKGKVCGLCGNFDDKSNNDFTTRSGLQETNALKFGNSWKQSSLCPDVTEEIKPCDVKPHRKSWAEKECSIIQSEVFKICHSKVDPIPFYEACVHDACSCDSGGDCECFCTAVAAYAQECTKAQACVFWRTPDICPIFCDYYNPRNECDWHYEPCGSNVTTCKMINNVSTNFSVPYLEGCYPRCPEDKPIYNEETKKCVRGDECGCYVNGIYVPLGGEISREENCTKCVCDAPGIVNCEPLPGCPCVINGTSYQVNETVAIIEDNNTCTIYICAVNGSLVPIESGPCPQSTTPTIISTSTPTSTLTTTVTTTSSPVTTTSSPVTTTSCSHLICNWTEWFDVSNPEEDGGDYETYEEIEKHGKKICAAPEKIECRAKDNPHISLEELGQKVECDVAFGLICKNEEQDKTMWELCYNYEISVYCCEPFEVPCETPSTPSRTPTTSTTTSTTVPTTTITRQTTSITTTPIPTPTITRQPPSSVTSPETSTSPVPPSSTMSSVPTSTTAPTPMPSGPPSSSSTTTMMPPTVTTTRSTPGTTTTVTGTPTPTPTTTSTSTPTPTYTPSTTTTTTTPPGM
ncbi:mucin-2 [Limosa lapponica baueri]|uniref:Mucin-2 n=1 Tax=Limosa lapponica baueri TaxID=1758121 RepID=A0A2I0TVS3_LIMLA|nr:mucin-2 [Limosa lapponica baueri]